MFLAMVLENVRTNPTKSLEIQCGRGGGQKKNQTVKMNI